MKIIDKNIFLIYLMGGILFINMLTGCQKELEEEFYNPDKQTDPSIEMLFAGALQPTELFRLDYGPGYHYIRNFNRLLGFGYFPYPDYNNQQDQSIKLWTGWSGGQLRNIMFQKVYVDFNKNIPVMNLMFKGLSEEEKENYGIYVLCVNIVKAYMFQKLTDAYDDVPFSEANGAFEEKFWAKYDTQKDIYYSLLDELKEISDKLVDFQLNNSLVHERFKTYDILNNGDVQKWLKFANSLRLRMAIRLSIVDPAKSESIIGDIIQNNAPLITEADDLIGMIEKDHAHVMEWYWPRAMKEMYYNCHAPYFMVHDVFGYDGVTTPVEDIDPRLYVVFQPNIFGEYISLKPWGQDQVDYIDEVFATEGARDTALNWKYDENIDPYFSMYNKMTYFNFDLKYPAFSPSETHLLLAEAAIRFPAATGGINPVEEYRTAISLSIDWYYELNGSNTYSESSFPTIPNDIIEGSKAVFDQLASEAFLTKKSNAFAALVADDKIKEIFYQKYAHYNILNHWEVWSEARRLQRDFGILVPKTNKTIWMERLYYPESEELTNPDNYSAVSHKNNHETPVWWTGR